MPVVLLAWDTRELADFQARKDTSAIERTFLWQGDARMLVSIVKSVEDWRNAEHDAGAVGVQVIILVEDNVRYYSSFLPVMYTELLHHSQRVIAEGLNLSQKILRMRARPKILLCTTWEEAEAAFERYADEVLGIISDVEFPRAGEKVPRAGADFARQVRAAYPDVPIVLHSSRPENEALAHSVGADFLLKGSPLLLQELRDVMLEHFGFGDFVFRRPDGTEVGRAADLRGLEEKLATVPGGVDRPPRRPQPLLPLAQGAHRVRPRPRAAPAPARRLREPAGAAGEPHPGDRLLPARAEPAPWSRTSTATTSTSPATSTGWAAGSLGGKARGLAFVRRLLAEQGLRDRFPGVEIAVPISAVLGTDIFDRFLDDNDLRYFAIECEDDARDPGPLPRRALPGGGGAGRGGVPRAGHLAPRGALLEPARGLAAPAVHRRLRHADAAEQLLEHPRAGRAGDPGDQARLRLDLLAAREGLPPGDALPAGGGEDGGDPPADRGGAARRAVLPGLLRGRPLAQLLPRAADGGGGRRGRGRARHGPRDRRGRGVHPLLPALPAAHPPVLLGRGHAGDDPARVLGAAPRGRDRGRRDARGVVRPRGGRGGRGAGRRRLDLLARERRRLRRPLAPGAAARDLRPDPEARALPARRGAGDPHGGGGAGDGHPGRDRVRGEPRGPAREAPASSASSRCGPWP